MVANPALTGFTAPKILWWRRHEPRRFDRVHKVLLPKDEIRRRLTGELATDVSDASGTLLLDVANRCWSRKLLSKLELDPDLLPACYESEDVTGTLTREAARALGLSPKCLVVGGAGDCAANGIGTGIVERGLLSASLGTSGVMFVHSEAMQTDPAGRLHTFCHAVRGKWHMMGVTLTAAGCLQWFIDEIGRQARSDTYRRWTEEAAEVPPGSEGLFFLPYLAGERTPHADPNARGCFIGLTLKHGRAHLVRAILEGVAYALRDSLEILRALGVPVRQIRISGGGSKIPLWRQIQADVFGQTVRTLRAEEGPAFGVALLAAVGAGAFSNIREACRATVALADSVRAGRQARARYDRGFPVYQQLYRSLRNDFPRLELS